MYIGVTAVGGHKLWGVVEGAGCGVRWFGGMGERWRIDGRRRGGCGPGIPGPYGGERKIVGRPALRPPRRGQDHSLRCRGETGCVKQ